MSEVFHPKKFHLGIFMGEALCYSQSNISLHHQGQSLGGPSLLAEMVPHKSQL